MSEEKKERKNDGKFYDFYWDGILKSEIGNSLPSFHSLPRFRRLLASCTKENGFYDFINFSAEKKLYGGWYRRREEWLTLRGSQLAAAAQRVKQSRNYSGHCCCCVEGGMHHYGELIKQFWWLKQAREKAMWNV